MAGNNFYLFGKFKTKLQDDYEAEIKGKSKEEIKLIDAKYTAELEIIEQRLMAEDAENFLQRSLFNASISFSDVEALKTFLSDVRKGAYGDKVSGDRVFELSYFDDIKALLSKSLDEYRGSIDRSLVIQHDESLSEVQKDTARLEKIAKRKATLERESAVMDYADTDEFKKVFERMQSCKTVLEKFINDRSRKENFNMNTTFLSRNRETRRLDVSEKVLADMLLGRGNSETERFKLYLFELAVGERYANMKDLVKHMKAVNAALPLEQDPTEVVRMKSMLKSFSNMRDFMKKVDAMSEINSQNSNLQSLYDEVYSFHRNSGQVLSGIDAARNDKAKKIARCDEEKNILGLLSSAEKGLSHTTAKTRTIEALSKDAVNIDEIVYAHKKYEKVSDISYLVNTLKQMDDERGKHVLDTSYVVKGKHEMLTSYLESILDINSCQSVDIMSGVLANVTDEQRENIRAFELGSYDRASEEMALIIQQKRLEMLFGQDAIREGQDGLFLYRAGYIDQETDAIRARMPGAKKQVGTHVGYGSSSKEYKSPFISTTTDPLIMATYVYNMEEKNAVSEERTPQMVIDGLALHTIMSDRLESLQTTPFAITGETDFLRLLMSSPEISSSPEHLDKINRRLEELLHAKVYTRDENLPTMIHPIVVEQVNEQEFKAIEGVREEGEAYSIRELGEDRRRKLRDFGRASLEVPIKSCIPVNYVSPDTKKSVRVTHEIDPLQSDFIQAMDFSDGEKLTRFIRENQQESVIRRLEAILSEEWNPESDNEKTLNPLEREFARLYYIERRPLKEIKKIFGDVDTTKKFNDPTFQLALSEQLRNDIIGKLSQDDVIRRKLENCGMDMQQGQGKDTAGVIPHGVERSVISDKEAPVGRASYQGIDVNEGQGMRVDIRMPIKRKKRSEAEKAARDYLDTIGKNMQYEISE
ncbi:MAG: hypothetical protein IJX99_09050 [Clostridia bacterium]|nr:hypothetical protein [Clostridia bacterium]